MKSTHVSSLSRRNFLKGVTAASGLTLLNAPNAYTATRPKISANEKLNIGVVGTAGRGGDNLAAVASHNIVALCDVDQKLLDAALMKHPSAKTFVDYRQMLELNEMDAVVVSTPDHTHTVIAAAVLGSGRPLYCEKPISHTISEVRAFRKAVEKSGLPTQTGNQIHAGTNYRRVVELVQSGAIGSIREVHHWAGSIWETKPRPSGETAPAHLNYDLWLGPVTLRDYSSEYVPFNWRRWWHFGGGTLADFCCHHMDLGVWALKLGLPTVIEAEGPTVDADCAPPWLIVHYDFPARGELPPVKMHWYSGAKRPTVLSDERLSKWGGGTLFVGSKGSLLADYSRHFLLPEEKFKDHTPPPKTIPNSPGHHQEWIQACKESGKTSSPLTYGALLTEIGLLGNVAYRTGRRIEWDAEGMKARNCPEADRYIHHEYRAGWTL